MQEVEAFTNWVNFAWLGLCVVLFRKTKNNPAISNTPIIAAAIKSPHVCVKVTCKVVAWVITLVSSDLLSRFAWQAFLHALFFWLRLPLLEGDILGGIQDGLQALLESIIWLKNHGLLGGFVWLVLLTVLFVSLWVELRRQRRTQKLS